MVKRTLGVRRLFDTMALESLLLFREPHEVHEAHEDSAPAQARRRFRRILMSPRFFLLFPSGRGIYGLHFSPYLKALPRGNYPSLEAC